jgi:hypothetical protein
MSAVLDRVTVSPEIVPASTWTANTELPSGNRLQRQHRYRLRNRLPFPNSSLPCRIRFSFPAAGPSKTPEMPRPIFARGVWIHSS